MDNDSIINILCRFILLLLWYVPHCAVHQALTVKIVDYLRKAHLVNDKYLQMYNKIVLVFIKLNISCNLPAMLIIAKI